ncbi:hypothetical protein HOLleu_28026 [Holothuria leucospilota]|uniref:Ig-like domain-containing protein n=1 Tax=Holothuria leucospilota TaxID=206669 RepID=A0A9Q1BRF4_HOLLE|nr:hypothetical protein HOLleu_28026 [Holothuria leucospilota]
MIACPEDGLFQPFITVLVVCLANVNAQVSFELVDSVFNEVIFVGERDIVVRCRVNGLSSLAIVIEYGENRVVEAQVHENCVDYTIKEISLNDRDMYRCRVVYVDTGGTMKTDEQSLHLNIQDSGPQCFRNGTKGQPYRDGERFVMSCYCWKEEDSRWVSEDVVGSGNIKLATNYEDTQYGNKTIRRILVDHSFTSDLNVKYTCFYISHAVRQCSLGPQVVSSNDSVISSTLSPTSTINGSSNHLTCSATSTPNYSTATISYEPVTSTPSTHCTCGGEDDQSKEPSPSLSLHPNMMPFVVIIIVLSVVTIILFLVLLLLFRDRILLKKKIQTSQKGEKSESVYDRAIYSYQANERGGDDVCRVVSHIYHESTVKDVKMQQSEPVYHSADELS